MEIFSIPGVGGIIEKRIEGKDYVLLQERWKDDCQREEGLIEIPAGKIREFENIFHCLRREIMEETGLHVVDIQGEKESVVIEENGYRVLNYEPFSCAQNLIGDYPIMVQVFICSVKGDLIDSTNETKNLRWVSLKKLRELLQQDRTMFYPMHITTMEKYLKYRGY